MREGDREKKGAAGTQTDSEHPRRGAPYSKRAAVSVSPALSRLEREASQVPESGGPCRIRTCGQGIMSPLLVDLLSLQAATVSRLATKNP